MKRITIFSLIILGIIVISIIFFTLNNKTSPQEDISSPTQSPAPEIHTSSTPTPTIKTNIQKSPSFPPPPSGTLFFDQENVKMFHYFPNTASLKGDESEILVYNEGSNSIQIISTNMKYSIGNKLYEQYSGTWEKFPSFQSWDKIEYININPLYYKNQPLILEPEQKGKIHYHYRFQDIGEQEKVDIYITLSVNEKKIVIKKQLIRDDNKHATISQENENVNIQSPNKEVGH